VFEYFFYGLQQDLKLFLFFPILSAVFRAIFIKVYLPYRSLEGRWKIVGKCFSYGFWWGMDFHAYIFLVSLLLVSLPSVFLAFFRMHGLEMRLAIGCVYAIILYAAFMGKMIFYRHFHDTYNYLIHMGRHAEKHNLVDIFFHQDHGWPILLGYILYIPVVIGGCWILQQIPSVPYYHVSSLVGQYALNIAVFFSAIVLFYWIRFGGTLNHRNKPEWDFIPSIVKEDEFLAKACVDDLIALKWTRKKSVPDEMLKSEDELEEDITYIIPDDYRSTWKALQNPLFSYKRMAKGARISKPSQIFLIVGESVPQWAMEPLYAGLNVLTGTKKLVQDSHTIYLNNFLPAGNVSRPSIVSLMTGIYDGQLELNEKETFWRGTVPTSLPLQMKHLGYSTIYWYGGNASNGNFNHFGKGQGFDRIENADTFCGPDAPRTWVGVYDHIFLQEAFKRIKEIEKPTFHFIYTTSNHGPYKIPKDVLQYDKNSIDDSIDSDIRDDKERCKALATARYADRAVSEFIKKIRKKFPDSLIIYTGDHSNMYGDLHNTSLIPRDYSMRELYCVPLLINHPGLSKDMVNHNSVGTHLSIIPTIIELIAPKDFIYYSLFPSLMEEQPEYLATPKQWLTKNEVGEVRSGRAEKLGESIVETRPNYVADKEGIRQASSFVSLTAWIVKHAPNCLIHVW